MDWRYLIFALLILSNMAVFYDKDPIMAYQNRYFLPVFAVLLVPASVGLMNCVKLPLFMVRNQLLIEIMVVGIAILWSGSSIETGRKKNGAWAQAYSKRMEGREQLGRWLDKRLKREDTFVIGDAGVVSYMARAKVIDVFCLNNAEMTRPPISRSADKFVEKVFDEKPDFIVIHNLKEKTLKPRGEYRIYPKLVRHPDFKSEYEHVKTFGMQGDNFWYWVFQRR